MKITRLTLCLSILLYSCSDNGHEQIKTIGETEYYFDEKLSSISLDNDGSYWVGSETGDLFLFKDNYRKAFDLGEDRIYKTEKEVSASGDTIFWIGIRNSGLQKWIKRSDDKLEKIKTYEINFKGDKYSPYDFVTVNNTLYLATSQGLYSLDKRHNTDSLSLIYPSRNFLSKLDGTTFVVHNIININDSLLLASTQGGLLWYNLNNKNVQFTFEEKHIEHVAAYNDTIYAISHEHLYLNNTRKDVIKQVKIGVEPRLYYQTQGIHYLVGREELLLSDNLQDFFRVRLKRSIPIANRNLILPDTLNNFSYLITENAVCRISNNIDIFKSNKAIKLSCFDSEKVYYLSMQNELYVQNKNEEQAKWLYTFPNDEAVQWMDIKGKTLYFYNTDNEFKKIEISNNWIKNLLFKSSKTILRSDAKITAAYVKQLQGQTRAYLGIQDGLITVDEHSGVDTISELSKVYITSMFSHDAADLLYISTLNNGVFYINKDMQVKQIPATENNSFIKDIITTNTHNSNLIMLTNQQIISEHPHDSVRVKGYQKLLYANDTTFYALPEFGIQKFIVSNNGIIDQGILYKDIRFKANSVSSPEGKLILISNIGASSLPVNNELNPTWIHFETAVNIEILKTTLLTLLTLLIAITATFILTKRRSTGVGQQKKHKEELLKRIDDLIIYYNILDDVDSNEILDFRKKIESVEINFKKLKNANILLDGFSQQIAKLNRQIALHIPKKLVEQIEQIAQTDSYEKPHLLQLSRETNEQDDIEKIKNRIKQNETWLQQRTNFLNTLDENINKLSDSIEIQGINQHLYPKLLAIRDDEKHRTIEELIAEYDTLKDSIERLNSAEVTSSINNYLAHIGTYIENKVATDSGLAFVSSALEKSKSYLDTHGNIATLKYLKPLGCQIEILEILDKIKSNTTKYKEINDQIIKENNSQINKKFDKELASYIEDRTRDITREINDLISSLYNKLLNTDSKTVIDILKLTNTEGQHARVLALLISDFKIKRILIPGMLGIYGNLNPVISRLINERIKKNEDLLKKIQKTDKEKNIFVYLVLQLLD